MVSTHQTFMIKIRRYITNFIIISDYPGVTLRKFLKLGLSRYELVNWGRSNKFENLLDLFYRPHSFCKGNIPLEKHIKNLQILRSCNQFFKSFKERKWYSFPGCLIILIAAIKTGNFNLSDWDIPWKKFRDFYEYSEMHIFIQTYLKLKKFLNHPSRMRPLYKLINLNTPLCIEYLKYFPKYSKGSYHIYKCCDCQPEIHSILSEIPI